MLGRGQSLASSIATCRLNMILFAHSLTGSERAGEHQRHCECHVRVLQPLGRIGGCGTSGNWIHFLRQAVVCLEAIHE